MALKMNVVTADDNEISNAYFKLVTTVVEWEANFAVFILQAWKSKNAYNNGKRTIMLNQDLSFKMDFPPGTEMGSRTDIYNWLKTLPYFATATDAAE